MALTVPRYRCHKVRRKKKTKQKNSCYFHPLLQWEGPSSSYSSIMSVYQLLESVWLLQGCSLTLQNETTESFKSILNSFLLALMSEHRQSDSTNIGQCYSTSLSFCEHKNNSIQVYAEDEYA